MRATDMVQTKGSTPTSGRQLKKLLDERRLVLKGAASAPTGVQRVALTDEVDHWPDHQRPAITTRG